MYRVVVSRSLVTLAAITALCATAGCSYPVTAERPVTGDQVNTDYAKLSGYMRSANRYVEETPADIRHAVIIDDAKLTQLGDARACFEATVRTGSRYDEPMSQLSPTCIVDGQHEIAAVPADETLKIIDYGYRGYENSVVAEGVAAGEYLGLQLSKPTDKVFRVIERRASICCPAQPTQSIELEMANERMGLNNPYGLKFIWQLR